MGIIDMTFASLYRTTPRMRAVGEDRQSYEDIYRYMLIVAALEHGEIIDTSILSARDRELVAKIKGRW